MTFFAGREIYPAIAMWMETMNLDSTLVKRWRAGVRLVVVTVPAS